MAGWEARKRFQALQSPCILVSAPASTTASQSPASLATKSPASATLGWMSASSGSLPSSPAQATPALASSPNCFLLSSSQKPPRVAVGDSSPQ